MREYGRVHSKFWDSDDVRDLTDDGRTLMLYLMTSRHGNLLGCYKLTTGTVTDDLTTKRSAWTRERVDVAFADLDRNPTAPMRERFDSALAMRDTKGDWVLLPRHLTYNPIENPNQGKAAAKLWSAVPRTSSILPALAFAVQTLGGHVNEAVLDGFEKAREAFDIQRDLFGGSAAKVSKTDTDPKGFGNPFETVSKPVAVAVSGTGTGTGTKEHARSLDDSHPACAVVIPLKGGKGAAFSPEQVAEFEKAFPTLEIEVELQRMRTWCKGQPASKLKTERWLVRFANSWMSRSVTVREEYQAKHGHKANASAVGKTFDRSDYQGTDGATWMENDNPEGNNDA